MADVKKKIIIEVDDKGDLKRTKKKIDSLNKSTNQASKGSMEYNRNMKGLSKQSSNASKNFSKTAQGMQGVLVPAYAEVAARVFALTAVYQALTKAADFRILMQGQAEYAKRTGKDMGDIAKQVQKAAKGMLDFKAASSAVALATTSGISSTQITAMTKAAVDSSTALGRSVTDTMDRLTRGIVKAEPEILDEIGVIIRLDKVYKDYAQSVSKSTAELTEGEKATARYNAIMGQLEDKFGGIADKVDPNYMRAAAAATLDILAQASTKLVAVVNPVLKFLSETKAAIVLILIVIMKNLLGKVFPVFETFGKKIAGIPLAMGKNVTALQKKIERMNQEIIKSRNLATNIHGGLDQANLAKWRGAAYDKAGTGEAGMKTKFRSMRATNVAMGRALGTGDKVTDKSSKYLGLTRAQYQMRIEDEKRLQKEILKTHSTSEIRWKRATVQVTKFNLVMQRTKVLFASAASAAATYFTATKGFIADLGIIKGMQAGIAAIQAEWGGATLGATLYERALRKIQIQMGIVGVITAGVGAIMGKVFGWVIALTMVLSIGSMILKKFVNFDTPFKAAADAAAELNDKLKKQKKLFDERDAAISFSGAAESFDQAMADITFMDNFTSSLYEATSNAMKSLSRDIGELGFWEGLINGIKTAMGVGLINQMADAAGSTAKMMAEVYPEVAERMRTKYGLDEQKMAVPGVARTKFRDWKQDKRDDPNYKKEFAQWKKEQNWSILEIAKRATDPGINQKEYFRALFPDAGMRQKTMYDLIKEIEDDENLSFYQRQRKLRDITADYNEELEESQKAARAAAEDVRAMTDALSNFSKTQKKFQESLLEKTAIHDVAVEYRKIAKILDPENTNLTQGTKFLQMENAGYVSRDDYTTSSERAQGRPHSDLLWTDIAYQRMMEAGGMDEIFDFDYDAADKRFMESITTRISKQQELKELQVFGSTTLKEQAELQKEIARLKLKEKEFSLEVLRVEYGKGLATRIQVNQAEVALQVAIAQANKLGDVNVKWAEARAKIEGRTLTIKEKMAALEKDLLAARDAGGVHSGILTAEDTAHLAGKTADEYETLANKLLNSLSPNPKTIQDSLDEAFLAFRESGKTKEWFNRMKDMGWGKFMDLDLPISGGQLDKLFQMSFSKDKEVKALPGKMMATKLELEKLTIEEDNLKKHKILIDFRKKMAEIEMKTQKGWVATEEMRLEAILAINKLQKEVNRLQLEEDLQYIKSTMDAIANGFGQAITQAFNDLFEGKDKSMWDTIREGVGKGMTSSAAENIGGMAQKKVFGNQGFLAEMLRKSDKFGYLADELFPQTQLEVAKSSLEELRDQTKELRLMKSAFLLGAGANTIVPGSSKGDVMQQIGAAAWEGLGGWLIGANGGIASGGFRAFAKGGVANRPTLGMIGEGRYNEAVVPLPDGRSIPVSGGAGNVTVNVAVDAQGQSAAAEVTGNGARELGYRVSQAVQQELVDQQRPGGLLSSY